MRIFTRSTHQDRDVSHQQLQISYESGRRRNLCWFMSLVLSDIRVICRTAQRYAALITWISWRNRYQSRSYRRESRL